jgi:hypothetical protein
VNRAVARRLAAVAAATLVVGGVVALAGPAAHAAQALSVLPTPTTYVDSVSGETNIVGLVKNTGTTNVEDVMLSFQFLNASSVVLDSGTTTALVDRLAPGESSPFRESFTAPAGYHHYTVTVSGTDVAAPPNHHFTVSAPTETTDAFGVKNLTASVRNDNTTPAEFVNVVFVYKNAGGAVVNATSEFVDDDAIAPGGSSNVTIAVEQDPAYSSAAVFLAQSNTDAAPGASPSPTPSASGSPSASPSPSPSGAPETTPTVTLGQSIISAGQRVVVTYHGTPNTTLQILSKTQPATAYSVISAVALDADGVGSTSHAPTKNTRIMARTAGGLSSLQPLIQVRSVASINAKRVGVRTYTFTGRVYPALNGRLVSLYRNGALVAQGRTDASGIYTITKLLAKGTFSFQVRTANDTYNLGTSSPAKTYTIS